jgi:hypothetical protein
MNESTNCQTGFYRITFKRANKLLEQITYPKHDATNSTFKCVSPINIFVRACIYYLSLLPLPKFEVYLQFTYCNWYESQLTNLLTKKKSFAMSAEYVIRRLALPARCFSSRFNLRNIYIIVKHRINIINIYKKLKQILLH